MRRLLEAADVGLVLPEITVRSRRGSLTPLCLCFLVCGMEVMLAALQGCSEGITDHVSQGPGTTPGTWQDSSVAPSCPAFPRTQRASSAWWVRLLSASPAGWEEESERCGVHQACQERGLLLMRCLTSPGHNLQG